MVISNQYKENLKKTNVCIKIIEKFYKKISKYFTTYTPYIFN